MAVVIREARTIGGKQYDNVKVYKSTTLVTPEAQRRADDLDLTLQRKMEQIQSDMRDRGLLDLRGQPGVLELWYQVGKALSFVQELEIEPADDRIYVWRALYDHAGELTPSDPGERASRLVRNHFRQCYQLGQLEWVFVKEAGTWSAWKDFLENRRVHEDDRIVRWLVQKSNKPPSSPVKRWLRKLTRAVNARFLTRDSTVLSEDELMAELEQVYLEVMGETD